MRCYPQLLIKSENYSEEGGYRMLTNVKIVDKDVNSVINYTQAIDLLQQGQVVAFPTETVYGLGAVATNEKAVAKIFEAKGRPSDNPLIVHVGTTKEINNYVTNIPEAAKKCMDAFWPGPLTLVLQAKPNTLAANVTAGLSTVGIRMPNHPVALALLQQLGLPVAAPSANKSGKPSPTKAQHVADDLNGIIPMVIDGGATGIGLESTVLDMTLTPPVILRPGGVTKEMLEEVIGPVEEPTISEHKIESTPKSPGMKYTHYAPQAPVYLIEAEQNVAQAVADLKMQGHVVALLAFDDFVNTTADHFYPLGERDQLETIGANLYDALRSCDKTTATIILVTITETTGVGSAIMNRLQKAAGEKWYK